MFADIRKHNFGVFNLIKRKAKAEERDDSVKRCGLNKVLCLGHKLNQTLKVGAKWVTYRVLICGFTCYAGCGDQLNMHHQLQDAIARVAQNS